MMKDKNIKQYAILHLVFIVVISGYFFFDIQSDIVFDSQTDERNIQVFRDEDSDGTFSKEQVEEILIDILIPLEVDKPIEGSSQNIDLSKQEGKDLLRKYLEDERVQDIINSKSFDAPKGKSFLTEIEEEYLKRGLEFPGVPSATPMQMSVEEWMMDVYYYLKHQVGNDDILQEPFFIEEKTTAEIQQQIEIYVNFAKAKDIVLPPSPIIEDKKADELDKKNIIIEAYLNGELRKLTNIIQQQDKSVLECFPTQEEIQKSVESEAFTTVESQIVLDKISACYAILDLKYIPPTTNITQDNPLNDSQIKPEVGMQSTVMESYFAGEIRKLQRLSNMNDLSLQDCLPTEMQIKIATQSDSFSSEESIIALGKIQDCYSLFKMDFSPPR